VKNFDRGKDHLADGGADRRIILKRKQVLWYELDLTATEHSPMTVNSEYGN
jgi:hypothetical protein